jgi:hypothetical protein
MAPTLDQYPRRDGLFSVLPEGVAAHNRYEDRLVMLDALASEIWLRADGVTSLRDIARDIAGVNGLPLDAIQHTVAIIAVILNSEGVLYPQLEPDPLPYHLALPQEDQDFERMHQSMAASGWLDDE